MGVNIIIRSTEDVTFINISTESGNRHNWEMKQYLRHSNNSNTKLKSNSIATMLLEEFGNVNSNAFIRSRSGESGNIVAPISVWIRLVILQKTDELPSIPREAHFLVSVEDHFLVRESFRL